MFHAQVLQCRRIISDPVSLNLQTLHITNFDLHTGESPSHALNQDFF